MLLHKYSPLGLGSCWILIAAAATCGWSNPRCAAQEESWFVPLERLPQVAEPVVTPASLPLEFSSQGLRELLPEYQLGLAAYNENTTSTLDASALPPEDDRFIAMEKRIKDLETQVKANAPKKVAAGEWEDLSAEKWTVKLGGHVQLDYINWANADAAITGPLAAPGTSDYFEFRRLRLVADGTGYGVFDFRLQMTLEPETVGESAGAATSPDVKDAYLSMNEIPWLGRMRIGNFFVPFSLEQVTNDTNNIFMERSIPTQGVFAADREVGLAFYNATEDKNFT